jgi:endo-1,4-beta-xylanase
VNCLSPLLWAMLVLGLAGPVFGQASDSGYAQYFGEQTANLPGEIKMLIDCSRLEAFGLPNLPEAKGEVVAVEGQPFAKAIRVTVTKPVQPDWLVHLMTPASIAPIRKGDTLFAIYNVRCTQSSAESGGGHLAAFMQLNREPWSATGSFSAAPGRSWSRGYARATAGRDYAPGEFNISFHLGQYAQTLEFGGLVVLNLGPNVDTTRLPITHVTYSGQEPDAPWRKEAEARIEKYRKGDLTVKVVDAAGKPLGGVAVHVQMKRHAYQFGTFLEGPTQWQNEDGQHYREYVQKWFTRVTLPIYWADWGWPKARPQYLERAQWAKDRGFHMRAHNLIWPGWHCVPGEIRKYENDPARLRQVIRDHFEEVVTALRPFGVDDYDVVNEVRENHTILDICGKATIVDWFKLAKQYDPKPRMGINECFIISGGGWTSTQQEQYAQMIQYLLDNGAPLEVIGFQCHFGEDPTPPVRVLEILDRFAKYKLPLQATEFDVDTMDEEAQADYLRDFYTAFFSHPSTEALTMWGFWEKVHWIPKAALIRSDWTLKPNGRVYQELVFGKWWTDVTGKTASDGTFTVRGFCGDYEVTAQAPSGEFQSACHLARDGAGVTLKP